MLTRNHFTTNKGIGGTGITVDRKVTKDVKERLNQYLYLKFEMENQLERIVRMKSAERFPAKPEGNGGGSGRPVPDRMASAVVRRIEQEKRVRERIEEIQTELDAIDAAINAIPIPLEREVLRIRYTDGDNNEHPKWKEIAAIIYGDDDEKHIAAIHRLHKQALVSVGKTL